MGYKDVISGKYIVSRGEKPPASEEWRVCLGAAARPSSGCSE